MCVCVCVRTCVCVCAAQSQSKWFPFISAGVSDRSIKILHILPRSGTVDKSKLRSSQAAKNDSLLMRSALSFQMERQSAGFFHQDTCWGSKYTNVLKYSSSWCTTFGVRALNAQVLCVLWFRISFDTFLSLFEYTPSCIWILSPLQIHSQCAHKSGLKKQKLAVWSGKRSYMWQKAKSKKVKAMTFLKGEPFNTL